MEGACCWHAAGKCWLYRALAGQGLRADSERAADVVRAAGSNSPPPPAAPRPAPPRPAQVVFNLDSSNVGPKQWVQLAKLLDAQRDNYDSFLVAHGTDTLA